MSAFFELGPNDCAPFMTLTAYVREDRRAQPGAVTHVDGTARADGVAADQSAALGIARRVRPADRRAGPAQHVVNRSVEPIVDSVHDAVTCLLTTGLGAPVVDDYIVTKPVAPGALSALVPVLPEHVRVAASRQMLSREHLGYVFWCEDAVRGTIVPISEGAYTLLSRADARRSIVELMHERPVEDEDAGVRECEALWHRCLIQLLSCGVSSRLAQGESSQTTIHSH